MEGDAGARQLNPTDADDTPDESVVAVSTEDQTEHQAEESPGQAADDAEAQSEEPAPARPERAQPRLGRGWLASICAVLTVLAGGAAVGGYLALRSHDESEVIARDDAAAVQAAKDCVAATQAPDTTVMSASQAKIVECSTGDFGAQAALYSSVLVDAYQAANVKVQVSEMRAAVERHHGDGSIDVLVALRVKVTNSEVTDQEQGYRLRVQMARADGTYKIAKLDQVTS